MDAAGAQVMETLGSERDGWTEKKAEAELRERLVRVERKGYRRPKKTRFAVYAESRLAASATKRRWSENTRRAYQAGLKRILPFFGSMAIDGIRPRHVAAFTAEQLHRYGRQR